MAAAPDVAHGSPVVVVNPKLKFSRPAVATSASSLNNSGGRDPEGCFKIREVVYQLIHTNLY
jgi:hypothetical protein